MFTVVWSQGWTHEVIHDVFAFVLEHVYYLIKWQLSITNYWNFGTYAFFFFWWSSILHESYSTQQHPSVLQSSITTMSLKPSKEKAATLFSHATQKRKGHYIRRTGSPHVFSYNFIF